MRKTARTFLVLVMSAAAAAVSTQALATEKTPSSTIIEAPYEPDYAKGLAERREWRRLRKVFLKKQLPLILRKHRDKLRCGTCMDVYMDLAFSVSLAGTVTPKQIDTAHACGGEFPEAMRADFLEYLNRYPFPAILRGKSVRLRLGSALKC